MADPDATGSAAPPSPDQWGVKAIREQMQDLDFPMTKDELMRRAGKWQVRMPGDTELRLGDLLDRVDAGRFRTPEDAVRAIARAAPETSDPGPW